MVEKESKNAGIYTTRCQRSVHWPVTDENERTDRPTDRPSETGLGFGQWRNTVHPELIQQGFIVRSRTSIYATFNATINSSLFTFGTVTSTTSIIHYMFFLLFFCIILVWSSEPLVWIVSLLQKGSLSLSLSPDSPFKLKSFTVCYRVLPSPSPPPFFVNQPVHTYIHIYIFSIIKK